ncbi:hypothetical protein DFH27DRAFT_639180 [Peziza echinospora]|nr:hypothetical protein DFH27DRAFT_639180 [Peziza echinospora]
MENYRKEFGLSDRDLPPTPTSYNSLPIRKNGKKKGFGPLSLSNTTASEDEAEPEPAIEPAPVPPEPRSKSKAATIPTSTIAPEEIVKFDSALDVQIPLSVSVEATTAVLSPVFTPSTDPPPSLPLCSSPRVKKKSTLYGGGASLITDDGNGNGSSEGGFFDALFSRAKTKGKKRRDCEDTNSIPKAFYDLPSASSILTPEALPEMKKHHMMHHLHHIHDDLEVGEGGVVQKKKKQVKIRVLCLSDLHGTYPNLRGAGVKVDVVVVAGDFTNSGTVKEVRRFREWLVGPAMEGVGEVKIVIPGNHECGLDYEWWAREGVVGVGEEKTEGGWEECVELLNGVKARDAGVVYLGPVPEDRRKGGRGCDFVLRNGARVKVWGCAAMPWIARRGGSEGVRWWAFGWYGPGGFREADSQPNIPEFDEDGQKEEGEGSEVGADVDVTFNPNSETRKPVHETKGNDDEKRYWSEMPAGLDILITHIPPKYHMDWMVLPPHHHHRNSCGPDQPVSTASTLLSQASAPTLLPNAFADGFSHSATTATATTASSSSKSTTGVTNTLSPPHFIGSPHLRNELCRKKPKLHIFGHVHERGGVQLVRWVDETPSSGIGRVEGVEGEVLEWVVPGDDGKGKNRKVDVVDLIGSPGMKKGKAKGEWEKVLDDGSGVGSGNEDVKVGELKENDQLEAGLAEQVPPASPIDGKSPPPPPTDITRDDNRPRSLEPPALAPLQPPPLPPSQGAGTSRPESTTSQQPPASLIPAANQFLKNTTCLVNASYVTQSWAKRREIARSRELAGGGTGFVRRVVVVEMEVDEVGDVGIGGMGWKVR